MRSRQSSAALFVALVLLLGTTSHSVADGRWLDGDLVSWNAAGMDIPVAPGESSVGDSPLCEQFVRPAETAEDVQVAERGWLLISPYQLAWGIAVVQGFLTLDPMCRPMSFQYFVFVDGVFAGTLAPEPMLSRTDGALFTAWIRADEMGAIYNRYTPTDGLCCPSAQTSVSFAVERTPSGPVVTPQESRALPAP